MDQKIDYMKQHIDSERDQLTGNLWEIESRFKSATDMRQKFNKDPLLGIGLAFGGGLLLSLMIGGSRTEQAADAGTTAAGKLSAGGTSPFSKLSGTVDGIVEAFVGLASTKIESLIADAIPGFHEQFQKVEREMSAPDRRFSAR